MPTGKPRRNATGWQTLDADEYISFSDEHHPLALSPSPVLDMLSALSTARKPFFKLAWWVIVSEGLERKPRGLMIENFRRGYLETHHYKTIARSCLVKEWKFQLWPTAWNSIQCHNLYNHEFGDSRAILPDTSGRGVPASPMFLKHFMFTVPCCSTDRLHSSRP